MGDLDTAALRALLGRCGLPELVSRPNEDGTRGSLWRVESDPDEDIPLLSARGFHWLGPQQTELIAGLLNGAADLLDAADERDRLRAELAEWQKYGRHLRSLFGRVTGTSPVEYGFHSPDHTSSEDGDDG